ncbi:MAG: ClpXP protease specificity-enhancing factor [Lysobacterales bacterium]
MSSNRPYLVRALHEWIGDNGLTPYLLVDAGVAGVHVPPGAVRDGRIVLNVSGRAVTQFQVDNDSIHFMARFGGVSQAVVVPMAAVLAIYAQENGQGMMFTGDATAPPEPPAAPTADNGRRARLRVVK